MVNFRDDPASVAKAQVEKWFGKTTLGPAFLTRDSRVFRLSPDETTRLREAAEAEVADLQMRMRRRTYLAVFIAIVVFMGMTSLSAKMAAPWHDVVKDAGFAIYAAHGLWILYESFQYDREVKSVRDGIAAAMAGRVPLPEMLTEQMTRGNPFQALLIGVVSLLFALYFVAELSAHRGVELIEMVPSWIYFGFLPLVSGLFFLGQYFDRNRGVGS